MKITDKIISIPPYISTSWDKVASLHMKNEELVVTLRDDTKVSIPHLPSEVIDQLFATHANFLEQQAHAKPVPNKIFPSTEGLQGLLGAPMKIVFGTLDSLMQALQHNPQSSNLPPIPPDIANKVEALAKMIPEEDLQQMPDPEPNCNCMYCQMQRILKKSIGKFTEVHPNHLSLENQEEPVADDELHFEEWDVQPTGDKMYLVTNKIDPSEHYNVFLGDPVGCTCGKPHCEHIIAVLRH